MCVNEDKDMDGLNNWVERSFIVKVFMIRILY